MKSKVLAVSLLGAAVLAGCSKDERGGEKGGEKAAPSEERVKHATNGQVYVTVAASTQQLAGLQTLPLKPSSVPAGVKASGRVLDPSPLAAVVTELATAESAAAASASELTRLQSLVTQNNASERALEAARAAAARDKALVQSARLRLLANWGKAIADRKDLSELVKSLSSLEAVLVELNVPVGDSFQALPSGAQLQTLTQPPQVLPAQFVSASPIVDMQFQARGYWFIADQNQARLAPGAALTGFINLPGAPKTGLELPRAAVVRHLGAAWVYVQRTEDSFERVMVQPGEPVTDGWLISPGPEAALKPGDKVVVVGAQLLLSEELKGQESE